MSIDTILKQILNDPNLKNKYWPELNNVEAQNMNTISRSNNVYLKYISAILSENITETNRRTQISNLLNN